MKPQRPFLKFFFRPHYASVCLLAIGLTFFISLGNWQLGRARVKDALYASFVQSNNTSGVSLAAALAKWPEQSYVRTEIRGNFIPGKTVLLDSQTAKGRIGVQVFQAFQSDDGMAVLVALGFIPIPPDRSSFPSPNTPSGQQSLKGLLAAPPASGIKLAEIGAAPRTASWLVTRIEAQTLSAYFGVLLPKPVLLLDASTLPEGTEGATDVLKLPRVWRPNTFPPERHRGYAATWFGFALTSVIIFLILHRNRKPNRFESSNEQPN